VGHIHYSNVADDSFVFSDKCDILELPLVTLVGHIYCPNITNNSFVFSDKCDIFGLLFVIFFVLFNLPHRYLFYDTNNTLIKISITNYAI
jgi:hypothetical protein